MDEIEITVFDEINDYKEKIYFFNIRQWIFAILITGIVIPTYLILKDKIGEEITSYIVIVIAGILGFIGFVKIHELNAEKIIPYWFRNYFIFAKPIHYITDEEYLSKHQKKYKNAKKCDKKLSKIEIKEIKNIKKQEKILEKARKKYSVNKNKKSKQKVVENKKENSSQDELSKKLTKLSKEQQEALLKLLDR